MKPKRVTTGAVGPSKANPAALVTDLELQKLRTEDKLTPDLVFRDPDFRQPAQTEVAS